MLDVFCPMSYLVDHTRRTSPTRATHTHTHTHMHTHRIEADMLGSISIASPPATPLFPRSTVWNDVEAEMRSTTWPSTLPSSPAATADQLASAQPTAAQVAAPEIQEAMLAGYGTGKRTNPAILARAEPPKKSKTADLSDVQREVESVLARVPSFSVLPSASRARILSNMTPEGRCDAQLSDRVAGTLQVLAPVRTEHARLYRLAVGSLVF